jgi:hypothetical protein
MMEPHMIDFARLKIIFSQCLALLNSPADAGSVVNQVIHVGSICKYIIKLNNISTLKTNKKTISSIYPGSRYLSLSVNLSIISGD